MATIRPEEISAILQQQIAGFRTEVELEETDTVLRPMRIARRCGCKFYCGSDVHKPERFAGVVQRFERAVDLLGLTEDDKFLPGVT